MTASTPVRHVAGTWRLPKQALSPTPSLFSGAPITYAMTALPPAYQWRVFETGAALNAEVQCQLYLYLDCLGLQRCQLQRHSASKCMCTRVCLGLILQQHQSGLCNNGHGDQLHAEHHDREVATEALYSCGLRRRASPFACAGAWGWAKLRLILAKSASAMATGITAPI